jgi:uncharacterized protein (DUF2141 family)
MINRVILQSFLAIVMTCFTSLSFAEASSSSASVTMQTLKINIIKIKQISGNIHFQLLACPQDDEQPWDSLELIQTGLIAVHDNNMAIEISAELGSSYILRLFQDINQNNRLDFSSNDIPKEPTGFSNNPSISFGEPTPHEACFKLTSDIELYIEMNNKKQKRKRRKHR